MYTVYTLTSALKYPSDVNYDHMGQYHNLLKEFWLKQNTGYGQVHMVA